MIYPRNETFTDLYWSKVWQIRFWFRSVDWVWLNRHVWSKWFVWNIRSRFVRNIRSWFVWNVWSLDLSVIAPVDVCSRIGLLSKPSYVALVVLRALLVLLTQANTVTDNTVLDWWLILI